MRCPAGFPIFGWKASRQEDIKLFTALNDPLQIRSFPLLKREFVYALTYKHLSLRC